MPAGVRVQSIDIGEVAKRLVAFAELGPLRHVAEIGGPRALDLETMATMYLRVRDPRRTTQVRVQTLQRPLFDVWRSGAYLAPEHAFGVITWE